jgi:hypothetical protein
MKKSKVDPVCARKVKHLIGHNQSKSGDGLQRIFSCHADFRRAPNRTVVRLRGTNTDVRTSRKTGDEVPANGWYLGRPSLDVEAILTRRRDYARCLSISPVSDVEEMWNGPSRNWSMTHNEQNAPPPPCNGKHVGARGGDQSGTRRSAPGTRVTNQESHNGIKRDARGEIMCSGGLPGRDQGATWICPGRVCGHLGELEKPDITPKDREESWHRLDAMEHTEILKTSQAMDLIARHKGKIKEIRKKRGTNVGDR